MGRDGPNDPRALQHLRHRPKPTNPRPNLMRSGNRSSPAYGWNCGHGSSTAQRRRARSPRPRRAHQRSAASVRVQARLLNPSETKSNRQRADKHYGQSDNEHSGQEPSHSQTFATPVKSTAIPLAITLRSGGNKEPQSRLSTTFYLGLLPLPLRCRRRLAPASKFLARNGKTLPDDACNLAAGRANSSCLGESRQCRRPDRAFLATHVRLCCGSQARWILHGQALRRQRHLDN
jgi:hypothetical protein